jgi:hypothetical protein
VTWTWTMLGRILYMMKVMGIFVNRQSDGQALRSRPP